MKAKNRYVVIVSVILMVLWAFMFVSKLYTHEEFKGVLGVSRWINREYAGFFSWALPACFALCYVLVLAPEWRPWGFLVSTVLLLVFTTYVAWIIISIDPISRPCNCGGLSRVLSWPTQLGINLLLTLLAGTASRISIKALVKQESRHPPAG